MENRAEALKRVLNSAADVVREAQVRVREHGQRLVELEKTNANLALDVQRHEAMRETAAETASAATERCVRYMERIAELEQQLADANDRAEGAEAIVAIINDGKCTDACDTYGHDDNCAYAHPVAGLVERIAELEQQLAARHDSCDAELFELRKERDELAQQLAASERERVDTEKGLAVERDIADSYTHKAIEVQRDLDKARAAVAELVGVLRLVVSSMRDDRESCPGCSVLPPWSRHAADCELAAALEKYGPMVEGDSND